MHLSWQPVALASAYQVWRDGNFIGLPTASSFTDEGVSFGGHHYEVRAVLALGDLTLGQSATTGVDVAMGTVVIDPGHGGSDSGATGDF
jgi:N-acetylmuramoyl-L-alanine amidase